MRRSRHALNYIRRKSRNTVIALAEVLTRRKYTPRKANGVDYEGRKDYLTTEEIRDYIDIRNPKLIY